MLMQTQEPVLDYKVPSDWRKSAKKIIELGQHLGRCNRNMTQQDYLNFCRVEVGLDRSAANKLVKIAEHPLLSNPEHFDRLPGSWALLYEIMFLDDDKIMEAIKSGAFIKATKYDVWDMRGMPRERGKRPSLGKEFQGCHVPVPRGMTLEAFVRSGMALETDTIKPIQAAAMIGCGAQSYRMVKAVILLTERDDLPAKDRALAKSILAEMNKTEQVRQYWDQAKPLIEKVWGTSRNKRLSNRLTEKRMEKFQNGIVVMTDACINCLDIEIPYLSDEVRAEAIERLTKAREAVSQLRNKIRSTRND